MLYAMHRLDINPKPSFRPYILDTTLGLLLPIKRVDFDVIFRHNLWVRKLYPFRFLYSLVSLCSLPKFLRIWHRFREEVITSSSVFHRTLPISSIPYSIHSYKTSTAYPYPILHPRNGTIAWKDCFHNATSMWWLELVSSKLSTPNTYFIVFAPFNLLISSCAMLLYMFGWISTD